MPKRYSKSTRKLAKLTKLLVALQVDVDKFAETVRATGRVPETPEAHTAAVLDFLSSRLVALARELR